MSNYRDGTQAAGIAGYASGFTDFAATPVAGTYTLGVHIPLASGSVPDFTATATLGSTTPLPTFAPPVYTSDKAGGGSVALTVPSGVTEALVYILYLNPDGSNGNFYTLLTRSQGADADASEQHRPDRQRRRGPNDPLKRSGSSLCRRVRLRGNRGIADWQRPCPDPGHCRS